MYANEYFDIFDENNKPLNFTRSRKEVHETLQYWHRATHIWIVNAQGEILCQQRSWEKDSNPGMWQSFFGGHVKAGESYIENALSELSEELGLQNISEDTLEEVYVKKSDKAMHHGMVYLLRWNGKVEDVTFDDGEVEQVAWLTKDELTAKLNNNEFCNTVDEHVFALI